MHLLYSPRVSMQVHGNGGQGHSVPPFLARHVQAAHGARSTSKTSSFPLTISPVQPVCAAISLAPLRLCLQQVYQMRGPVQHLQPVHREDLHWSFRGKLRPACTRNTKSLAGGNRRVETCVFSRKTQPRCGRLF